MRLFILVREEDVTGVSGTGVVAEGIEYSDGRVSLRWCVGEHRSTVAWDSMEAVEKVHGHDGRTQVVRLASWDIAAAIALREQRND